MTEITRIEKMAATLAALADDLDERAEYARSFDPWDDDAVTWAYMAHDYRKTAHAIQGVGAALTPSLALPPAPAPRGLLGLPRDICPYCGADNGPHVPGVSYGPYRQGHDCGMCGGN